MLSPIIYHYTYGDRVISRRRRSRPFKVSFNLKPASFEEFKQGFDDIKDIKFISKKKSPGFSEHTVKIHTYDGNIETATLIKESNNGQRRSKNQRLGSGSFKYVQAAILIRDNKPPLKFALSTQEYLETNDDIPQDIRDELEISNRSKDKQALHESVVIPKYFSPKLGKVQIILKINSILTRI